MNPITNINFTAIPPFDGFEKYDAAGGKETVVDCASLSVLARHRIAAESGSVVAWVD
jgi:hypothetical protein